MTEVLDKETFHDPEGEESLLDRNEPHIRRIRDFSSALEGLERNEERWK